MNIVGELTLEFLRWSPLAAEADRVGHENARPGSTLRADAHALSDASPESTLWLGEYVSNRLQNIARTLRRLSHMVFMTDPGVPYLDGTSMYPLLRSALEDAGTLGWMVEAPDQTERLHRAFRVFWSDTEYFGRNRVKLVELNELASEVELSATKVPELKKTIEAETAQYEAWANAIGYEFRDKTGKVKSGVGVGNRTGLYATYGQKSAPATTWHLLSDLSHYSFQQLRHFDINKVEEYDGAQLGHVSMLLFARVVSCVVGEATTKVAQAKGLL